MISLKGWKQVHCIRGNVESIKSLGNDKYLLIIPVGEQVTLSDTPNEKAMWKLPALVLYHFFGVKREKHC